MSKRNITSVDLGFTIADALDARAVLRREQVGGVWITPDEAGPVVTKIDCYHPNNLLVDVNGQTFRVSIFSEC